MTDQKLAKAIKPIVSQFENAGNFGLQITLNSEQAASHAKLVMRLAKGWDASHDALMSVRGVNEKYDAGMAWINFLAGVATGVLLTAMMVTA